MARYSINFNKRFEELLEDMANEKGITKAETLRRAMVLYSYLGDQVESGKKIVIAGEDDQIEKEVVFS